MTSMQLLGERAKLDFQDSIAVHCEGWLDESSLSAIRLELESIESKMRGLAQFNEDLVILDSWLNSGFFPDSGAAAATSYNLMPSQRAVIAEPAASDHIFGDDVSPTVDESLEIGNTGANAEEAAAPRLTRVHGLGDLANMVQSVEFDEQPEPSGVDSPKLRGVNETPTTQAANIFAYGSPTPASAEAAEAEADAAQVNTFEVMGSPALLPSAPASRAVSLNRLGLAIAAAEEVEVAAELEWPRPHNSSKFLVRQQNSAKRLPVPLVEPYRRSRGLAVMPEVSEKGAQQAEPMEYGRIATSQPGLNRLSAAESCVDPADVVLKKLEREIRYSYRRFYGD